MDMVLFSRVVRREAPTVLILKKLSPPERVPQGGAKERPYVMTALPVQA